ncbi:unnamed protein product, partial [Iphiclides podalirius]
MCENRAASRSAPRHVKGRDVSRSGMGSTDLNPLPLGRKSPRNLVLSSGSFELRIKSFTNSLGRLSSGQCCDGSSTSDAPCLAPCRTKFRVCLKIYQANIDTTSPCTFGDITTPVLGGNSLDVPNLNVEGFSNPIVFPFDFTWPRAPALDRDGAIMSKYTSARASHRANLHSDSGATFSNWGQSFTWTFG